MDSQQLLRNAWRKQQHDTLEAILHYRVWVDLIRSITVGALAWSCSFHAFAADAGQLASVQANEPGEWRPFAIGQMVASPATGTGPSIYWKAIPDALRTSAPDHYYLKPDATKKTAEEYGQLDFEIVTGGPVWMLVLSRPGNEAASATLQANGWHILPQLVQAEYGYAPFGQNTNRQDWLLFERTCKSGERFSVRTETYQSPVILRTLVPKLQASKYKSGGLIIEATGNAGRYKVQSSSDLKTWVDEGDAALNSLEFQLVAGSSFTVPQKFYRLVLSTQNP